jgi:hypothetical protein
MKPGMFAVATFDATYVAGSLFYKHYVTPATCYTTINSGGNLVVAALTPCAAVSTLFKYGRGTQKFRIEINCSKVVTGRIRVFWAPSYAELPAIGSPVGFGEGDYVSTVIEFTGDTAFNFSIPYLKDNIYMRLADPHVKSDTNSVGAVGYSIVNSVVAMQTTASTTVTVAFYTAVDDDYCWNTLCDRPATFTLGVRTFSWVPAAFQSVVVAQDGSETEVSNVLDDIFSRKFPPLLEATSRSFDRVGNQETYTDIYTLLHKPVSVFNAFISPITNPITLGVFPSGNRLDPSLIPTGMFPMLLFMQWANFYRGGFNHSFNFNGTPTSATSITYLTAVLFSLVNTVVQIPSSTSSNTSNTPIHTIHVGDRHGMSVHEPYRSLCPFSSWPQSSSYIDGIGRETALGAYFVTTGSEISSSAAWYVSCDDDTRLAWFMGTPLFIYK